MKAHMLAPAAKRALLTEPLWLDELYMKICGRISDHDASQASHLLTFHPDDPEPRLLFLCHAFKSDQWPRIRPEAVEHLRWLIHHYPRSLAAANFTIQCATAQQSVIQQLENLWDDAIEAAPQSAAVLAHAALLYVTRTRRAIPRYESLLRASCQATPRYFMGWQFLAQFLFDTQRFKECIDHCNYGIALPEFLPVCGVLLWQMAKAAFGVGDDAIAAFAGRRLLQVVDTVVESHQDACVHYGHTCLGLVAFRQGEVDRAAHHLELSVRDIRPPHDFCTALCDLLFRSNQLECVRAYLHCIESLYPELAQVWRKQVDSGVIPDWRGHYQGVALGVAKRR